MKPKLLNLNYKKSIFCYILAISLIPIFILGMYSYRTYINGLSTKMKVSTNATANQVKGRVDNILINIRRSYIEAVEDDKVKWLLKNDIWYSDYTDLVAVGNTLSGPTYYSEYIDGYTFINFDTNWVLSNRGMFRYDLVTNKEDVEELFHMNDSSLIRNFWVTKLTKDTKTLRRETINLRNLSLVLKLPSIQKYPHSLLIVNINMRGIQDVLKQDLADSDITVIDKAGNLIYTTNKEVANSCIDIKENPDNYKMTIGEMESLTTKDGKSYSISTKDSDAMDWYYIVSYDNELIKDGGDTILSITFLIILITLVIVLVAVIFTHRLYTPILNLSQYVTGILPSKDNDNMKNEFDFITRKFDRLVDNKALLEKLVVSQQPQMMELFQIRLIRGEIKEEQIINYLDNLNLKLEPYYMVMSINIKSQNGIEVYDEAKQDAIRIDVVENLPEQILSRLIMPPVCNARTILCAITADNKPLLEEKILLVYEMLDEHTFNKYGFRISIGVSTIYEEFAKFGYAYQESIAALKNNDVFNQKNIDEHHEIMFYSDVTISESGYTYEKILERELRESIDLCEKEKAFAIIDRFIDSLIKHNVLHNEISLSLQRILISSILVAYDAGLQVNRVFDEELSSIFSKYNQMYDMNKVRSFLKYQIIEPIIIKLDEFRTSKSTEIMAEIQKIIDKNNGDITLTECAEQLGYHPTYIWRVMKIEKNTTFSNYVGEHKLEEAKRLLIETDLTVLEIASKLSYTNSQNFIRFFSKLEGVTPGKYRQANRKHNIVEDK
jgi:two-component system response regulator YesN